MQPKSRASTAFGVDSPRVGESGLWGAGGGWGEGPPVSSSPGALGAAGSVWGVGTVGGTATTPMAPGGVGVGAALATGGVGGVGGGAAFALAPGPAGGRKKMVSTLRTRACSTLGSVPNSFAVSATTVTSQYTAAGAAAAGASGPLIHNGVEGGCPSSCAEVAEVAAAPHKAEEGEGKGGGGEEEEEEWKAPREDLRRASRRPHRVARRWRLVCPGSGAHPGMGWESLPQSDWVRV